jgi:hypothetical protein
VADPGQQMKTNEWWGHADPQIGIADVVCDAENPSSHVLPWGVNVWNSPVQPLEFLSILGGTTTNALRCGH